MNFTKEDIGRKVYMYRLPLEEEWETIGKIEIRIPLNEICTIRHIDTSPAIYVDFMGRGEGYYPSCCFKFAEEHYELY